MIGGVMGKFKDLTGQRFGRLVVKQAEDHIYPSGNRRIQWLCRCDCDGKEVVVKSNLLLNGHTQSCGCLHSEIVSKFNSETKKLVNEYDLSGEYGIGYATGNKEFYFDLEDYDKIKDYMWHVSDDGYVTTNAFINGKYTTFSMHRLVMDCLNEDFYVDHIKHHPFDNRKSELRVVTSTQNTINRCMVSNNTSGATGVSWSKANEKWVAYIGIDYKTKFLGYFDSFDAAVNARMAAEEKYFGEYSYRNSMKESV